MLVKSGEDPTLTVPSESGQRLSYHPLTDENLTARTYRRNTPRPVSCHDTKIREGGLERERERDISFGESILC